MNYEFDYYGDWRKPQFILCKPNGKRITVLGQAIERRMNLNYTSVSELTFTVPRMVNDIKTDGYDSIAFLKKIYLDTYKMWFTIHDVNIVGNGIYEKKEVTCYSLESALVRKGFFLPQGVYQLYNPVSPDSTILGMLLKTLPNWHMGHLDPELYNLWRSFEDTEDNIYSFLTSTIADAYGCIFNFSSVDSSINVYDATKNPTSADIILSPTNLIKEYQIEGLNEDFATALNITGGNVDLTGINVDGTNIIYNLDSVLTTDYLEQDTIDAWKAFRTKRNSANTQNINLLAQLRIYQSELLKLQSQAPKYEVTFTNNTVTLIPALNSASGLAELQSLDNQLNGVKKSRMEATPPLTYNDVNIVMNSVTNLINTRNSQITAKQSQIDSVKQQRTTLANTLLLEKNFTEAQLKELDEVIIVKDWTDQSFIVTDVMTDVEKQDVAQALYDFAMLNLERISQKRYQFEIDSVNFVALQEYEIFTGRLNLGQKLWIDIREDYRVQPALLGIEFNFDDEREFVLKFSNKTAFQEDGWSADDWTNESARVTNSLARSLANIKEMERSQDDVTRFINGNFVAANNAIINAENQEVTYGEFGLRLRQKDSSTGRYKPQETWIMSNLIALTNDNFQTSDIAIGMIKQQDGSYINSINAGVVAGRLIAGNQIILTNEKNSFTVDGNGLTAENANMYFIRDTNRIEINPTDGIVLKKNGVETVKLSLQTGDGSFSGNINASTFTGGSINIGNGQFTVDSAGKLTANNAVIKGTIESSSFTGGSINIGNGQFTVNNLGNAAMRYAVITGGSVTLGNTTITESQLRAYGAYLDSTSRYDGPISGSQLSANSITTNHLQAGSITAGKIAAGAVTANEIQAGAITANKIQSGAITANHIQSGAITAGKIAAGAIDAMTITGATIRGGSITGEVSISARSAEILNLHVTGQLTLNSGTTISATSVILASGANVQAKFQELISRIEALE